MNPVREGLRAVWMRPAVVSAEIAWRWGFGCAALALAGASLLLYLSTLHLTNADLMGLGSRTPWLIAGAVAHILRGSGHLVEKIALVLTPALAVLWIATASLGRIATLRGLLPRYVPGMSGVVQLNLLRAVLFLGSLAAYLGAAVLAGHAANTGPEVRPDVFLITFFGLAAAITLARSRANWFPYLAAIFVVRDGLAPRDALARSSDWFSRRSGQVIETGVMFGVLHVLAAGAAMVVSLALLGLLAYLPKIVLVAFLASVSLGYFAVADFLYIARLAAYAAIAEDDRAHGTGGAPFDSQPSSPNPHR